VKIPSSSKNVYHIIAHHVVVSSVAAKLASVGIKQWQRNEELREINQITALTGIGVLSKLYYPAG